MGIVKSIDERVGRFGRKRPIHFLMIVWIIMVTINLISDFKKENLLRSILDAMGEASLVIIISLAIIQYFSFIKIEMAERKSNKKLILISLFVAIISISLFGYYIIISDIWPRYLDGTGILITILGVMLIFSITFFATILAALVAIKEKSSNAEESASG